MLLKISPPILPSHNTPRAQSPGGWLTALQPAADRPRAGCHPGRPRSPPLQPTWVRPSPCTRTFCGKGWAQAQGVLGGPSERCCMGSGLTQGKCVTSMTSLACMHAWHARAVLLHAWHATGRGTMFRCGSMHLARTAPVLHCPCMVQVMYGPSLGEPLPTGDQGQDGLAAWRGQGAAHGGGAGGVAGGAQGVPFLDEPRAWANLVKAVQPRLEEATGGARGHTPGFGGRGRLLVARSAVCLVAP